MASGKVIVRSAVGSVTANNNSFVSTPPLDPSKVIPWLYPPLLSELRTIFPPPPCDPTCNLVIAWILVNDRPVIVSPKETTSLPRVIVEFANWAFGIALVPNSPVELL